MSKLKKIVSVVIISLLMFGTLSVVFAEESSTYYRNEINKIDQEKKSIEEQKDSVQGEIDEVLQEVANLNSSILEYEGQIQQLTEKAEELEKSIEKKEQELAEKKQILENRLVAMYTKKETTFLDVILTGNLMSFISNQDIIKQAAEYDNKLIQEVESLKKSLETEKLEIENVKKEKQAKTQELQNLKSQKEAKAANLSEEQKELESKLSQYRAQAEQYATLERQAIAKEQAARQANANKTSNASNQSNSGYSTQSGQTTSNPYTGGKLGWPCPSSSRITSPYGYRILFGVRDFHTGIDIGAVHGSNIVAAESGTVILANYGWNGGYGNYIILSHGNGITTRYAHASQLYVSAGQTVSKGQVIAAVGTTGNSTGPHLHFEVRTNGVHTNPLNYL